MGTLPAVFASACRWALVLTAVSMVPAARAAVVRSLTESFDTTVFRDPAETTADWNTGSGELSLFPFQPSLDATLDTPGTATGIFVDGDLGFVADFTGGLRIVDVSNASTPALLSTFASTVQAVVASGDFAYLAAGSGGLKVVRIADPTSPALVGAVATTGATGIAVGGTYAYLADGSAGLRVISISVPSSPSIAATFNTAGSASDIETDGEYVYLADGSNGFLVFDVSVPSSPQLLATVDTPGNAFGIDVRGNRAYLTDTVGGLLVYDVSVRASPELLGSIALSTTSDVFVAGDRAYVASNSAGVRVVDLSDESAPQLLYEFDTTDADDVFVEGDLAYVADSSAGLRILRTSEYVDEPLSVAEIAAIFRTEDIAISGSLACIADGAPGLRIIDLSIPSAPALLATYDTPNLAAAVVVAGRVAYLGDSGTILALDISDPTTPTLLGSIYAGAFVWDLRVDGDRLYAALSEDGLGVFDVSNPASLIQLGSFDASGPPALGIDVAGDHAFLAVSHSGLQIIDVSDPASPSLTGTCDTPGQAHKVRVAGDVAYVGDQSSLQIVDITNLGAPTLLGSLPGTSSEADALAIDGNRVLLAQTTRLAAVDVTDPSTPALAFNHVKNCSYGLELRGPYALAGKSFEIFLTRQELFDASRRRGQSLTLSAPIPVVRARLTSTQTGDVDWELSANGGGAWQAVQPGGAAVRFTSTGTDVRWRSTHRLSYPLVDPAATSVKIDWFYESAEIDGINDVPNDQGGAVRVRFGRSGYDFVEETASPVTGYQIWARIDDESLLRAVEEAPLPESLTEAPGLAQIGRDRLRRLDDRTFLLDDPQAGDDFPPGTWEALAWVAALQRDDYVARAETQGDSTSNGVTWTTYCVTTHTTVPSVWYASEPDSGFSIDNIAPAAPSGLALTEPSRLTWDPAPEVDFAYFSVYGSELPTLDETAVRIGYTTNTEFDVSGQVHGYYHVTATDDAGNEGGASSISNPTADIDGAGEPRPGLALHAPKPNPTGGVVEFSFGLAETALVSMSVYDVRGSCIRELPGAIYPAGNHRLVWSGEDDDGRPAPAGHYFVRMQAGAFTASTSLVRIE